MDEAKKKVITERSKYHPNKRLKYQRELQGLTQRELVDRLIQMSEDENFVPAISEDSVSRWERGVYKPEFFWQRKLCNLFGKNAVELGFLEPLLPQMTVEASPISREEVPQQDIGSDDMNRRQTLQFLGAAGATLVKGSPSLLGSPLWERLSKALAKSSRLDDSALDGLATITKSYWQLRTKIGYRDLLSGFMGHLETVTQLLKYSHPSSTHQCLCSLASEIAQRIGSIYFDMNDHFNAQSYYIVSIEAAQEADNHTLWAIGLGKMSSLPTYKGRAQEAIPYLQEAQRVASQRNIPTIRTWLAAVEAEAHAHLNNSSACLQVLDRAESIVHLITPEEEAYGIHFDHSRLAGYKGVCFLRLQEPNLALAALNEAISFNRLLSPRQESIIIADSAFAYAHLREVEEACKFANQALAMGIQTKSELVIQRIRTFREEVKQWENLQPVKDLDMQLVTLTNHIS